VPSEESHFEDHQSVLLLSMVFFGWIAASQDASDHQDITPWKINMEPTNHPFGKENDLNQTSVIMFHVNLQGSTMFSRGFLYIFPINLHT